MRSEDKNTHEKWKGRTVFYCVLYFALLTVEMFWPLILSVISVNKLTLLTYLNTYILTDLIIYILTYLLTDELTYLLKYLLTDLIIYILTDLLTDELTYLLTYLNTYLFTYLLTY